LRQANVSTTATDYVKTAADDVRNALTMPENRIAEAGRTQTDTIGTLNGLMSAEPNTIQEVLVLGQHGAMARAF
jgi:hypothetical protein